MTNAHLFEEVFDRHYNAVRLYAQRRLGTVDGEEIAAATFEHAFRQRARFDTDSFSSARPWLLGIANNLVRRHLRREDVRRRHPPLSIAVEESQPEPTLDALAAAAVAPSIWAALDQLSEGDRETFLLLAQSEITYAEAADALGIPIGTVRSRMNRVRRRMRELLMAAGAINPGEQDRGSDV